MLGNDLKDDKTTLADDLRALLECPRELWLVYLATFFEYLGVFSFLPTLPLWLSSDFAMTDKQAGWWAADLLDADLALRLHRRLHRRRARRPEHAHPLLRARRR